MDLKRYKNQRNRFNNIKKNAKDNYKNNLEEIISNNERGNKTFRRIMGRCMPKSNSSLVNPPLRGSDGTCVFMDIEKASTLNDYFCSISSIDDGNTELLPLENRANTQIDDINITESEIIDMLSCFNVNKACSPDGISHRMLKYTSNSISVPLCKVFNYLCKSKSAKVMSVFKKVKNLKFVTKDRFL